MAQSIGPRTDDKVFFSSLIDTSLPGLEEIPEAAAKGDFRKARRLFADYVRSTLDPEYFINMPCKVHQNNSITLAGETWRESADRICRNHLVSCSTEFQFGEKIDYFSNPTFNQYKEWTWQLSRHNEWVILGYAYLQTGDEKYAEACAKQFDTWVKQALSPEPRTLNGSMTLCWRTIEAGIRMGSNWQYALHTFYKSPAFTDDIITDWYKSVWEHGERLYNDYRTGNWLLMEMDGLTQIGIFYPVLLNAKQWFNFAVEMLDKQLDLQFYPDGLQYELTTHYHHVSINCYIRLMRVAKAYGVALPDSFLKKLEGTIAFYGKLIMPDFRLPNLNDGTWVKAGNYISEYIDFYPQRKDFTWIVSEGSQGEPPPYNSIALPWSGLMAFRTGWDADTIWGLLDAAPFGRAHQHEDKLSLLIYMNGRLVLTEGGIYAYDDSQMRKYVLSTRSHNTIRVNGMDQNRGLNFKWEDDDIKKESGMIYSINEEYDYAAGLYNEGYGPKAEQFAVHERAIIFLKKPSFTAKPFFIVIDRLHADRINKYESLWHFDVDSLLLEGLNASAAEITILQSGAKDMSAEIVSGQEEPEWQGWKTITSRQGDFQPIPTLRYNWDAASSFMATIFFPSSIDLCPIVSVEASESLEGMKIIFHLRDNSTVTIDEKDYK